MKILILIEQHPYFQSSASANRWCGLIDGLLENGANIFLVITRGYNNPAEYKNKTKLHPNLQVIYTSFLFNHSLWLRRINKFILSPIFNKFEKNKIYNLLVKTKPDIFWTSSSRESFEMVVSLKQKYKDTKYFLELSEFMDIHLHQKVHFTHKKEGDERQSFFENKALHAYDGLALMTKNLVNHYLEFQGKLPAILHLPMTVDLTRFDKSKKLIQEDKKLKSPYVLFVGVMNDAKDGVNILIDSFAKINKEYPELYLHLVGPYNYDTPGHKQQIKNHQLQDKIIWHGEVHRDTIPNYIVNAKLLALPRPASKQAEGGFPTKLGEYLASGRPVCLTNVGEIPFYLKDNVSAFFSDPGSIDGFYNCMKRALSDDVHAESVGMEGQKVARKEFNKDIQSTLLYEFLLKLKNNEE